MFGKRSNENALGVPPMANENRDAVEVLRVWAAPGKLQQLTLRPIWEDPGAWGIVLVDVAHHAAQAYEMEGRDPGEVLARIRARWDAEWARPTDSVLNITPKA